MARPEDIPERVWAEAEEAYQQSIYMTTSDTPQAMVAMVARSILAAEKRVREEPISLDVIKHYYLLIPDGLIYCEPDPGTSYPHLMWMLSEMEHRRVTGDKAHRWLGFIQGILIERGLTTVQAERDFTRPFFAAIRKGGEHA